MRCVVSYDHGTHDFDMVCAVRLSPAAMPHDLRLVLFDPTPATAYQAAQRLVHRFSKKEVGMGNVAIKAQSAFESVDSTC